jgi:Rad3-related DNA helicase
VKESTVLTSATLTTEGNFDYIRSRLGAEDAREVMLGSPFDYANSTLILSPTDMPEPDQAGYAAALHNAIIELTTATQGRALVLFTSHSALRAAYEALRHPLEREQILVLAQGIDGSPKQLLSLLKTDQRTVVLGAASFWEGVDVSGEALSLLVMARLPFSVPSDPVFRARSDLFEQPFEQYALPQAILRFKQGFGRLIRRKTDRGVVAVLDRRLLSKRYGEAFLRSLPACTLREGPLRDLPAETTAWLGATTRLP